MNLLKFLESIVSQIFNAANDSKLDKDQKMLLMQKALEIEEKVQKNSVKLMITDQTSGSWLQRNCRPLCVISIVSTILALFIFYPVAEMNGLLDMAKIPSGYWKWGALLICFCMIWATGRSGEKFASIAKMVK